MTKVNYLTYNERDHSEFGHGLSFLLLKEQFYMKKTGSDKCYHREFLKPYYTGVTFITLQTKFSWINRTLF